MSLGLFIAILRYLLILPISWAATLLAYLFAPIAALPIFVRLGITGREYLVWLWQWLTTHDAPVDSFFIDAYFSRSVLLGRFTREQILASAFLRYVGRVMWIWRNPAYYIKHHYLGFDTTGTTDAYTKGVRLGTQTNERGQVGFLYERRFRYLHIQFGWKLYRSDPDGKRMYAFRVKPELRPGWS